MHPDVLIAQYGILTICRGAPACAPDIGDFGTGRTHGSVPIIFQDLAIKPLKC